MKKIENIIQEIENEWSKNKIISNLPLFINEIDNTILKIKSGKDIADVKKYFDLLNRIQSIIARLWMEENIEISSALKRFVKDFDRIDDENTQHYLFKEIKSGRYPLIELHDLSNS